ncbi:DUF2474 family protein [Roseicella aquatilis]|uniref:DUF2474 family protein n=1 Tax=Roseicella aquatilis TaxID=2527868 RepID=A0A4R4DI76_9PROT|nr:DUF2474 family protein [Roseicella aquatilis]TCZ60860.1 DUF2474 family protein [Roseicella aquatilis]
MRQGLGRRLLWFLGLWLAGIVAVGAVATLLRAAMRL